MHMVSAAPSHCGLHCARGLCLPHHAWYCLEPQQPPLILLERGGAEPRGDLTSVPEFVKRTISTEGTASITIFARTFSFTEGAPKEVPFSRVACRSEA